MAGAIVLTSGQTVQFSAIVPTVFNGTVFPGSGVGAIPQREEMVDFALQFAQDGYPGCRWHSVRDVDVVPATPGTVGVGVGQRRQRTVQLMADSVDRSDRSGDVDAASAAASTLCGTGDDRRLALG